MILLVYRVRRAFFLAGEASYVHTVIIDQNISGTFLPAPAGGKLIPVVAPNLSESLYGIPYAGSLPVSVPLASQG
jgi:hypothetical protein